MIREKWYGIMDTPQIFVVRMALFGAPGSGKSTTCSMIGQYCAEHRIPFAQLRLADPLYEAQAAIYRIAGVKLDDFYQQDGELLNFLGYYLRKLNPTVLTDRFAARLLQEEAQLVSSPLPMAVVVCSDLRPADAAALEALGFLLIRVVADRLILERRRRERGDRSLGSLTHPTEAGMDELVADHLIENNATLEELRVRVDALMAGVLDDTNWAGDTQTD